MAKNSPCPFAPPYPSTELDLLANTKPGIDRLSEHGPGCHTGYTLALVIIAHDAVQHALHALKNGGDLSADVRQRLLSATSARVRAVFGEQQSDRSGLH
jgi:hypothetical protein